MKTVDVLKRSDAQQRPIGKIIHRGPIADGKTSLHVSPIGNTDLDHAAGRESATQVIERFFWMGQVLEYLLGVDQRERMIRQLVPGEYRNALSTSMLHTHGRIFVTKN